MITYVFYNKQSEFERTATDLAAKLKDDQIEVKLIDADSPEGIQLSEHYDITGRPAILITRDPDGSPVQLWQGMSEWPLASDVVYAART